jgi:spore coat polysaccharide biosynthesis protein SpsF
MVFRIVSQLSSSERVNEVVVTTTTDRSDDELVAACEARSIAVERGPVDDIATRLLQVARRCEAAAVVRVWGDCPFVRANVVDAAVDRLAQDDAELVTNAAYGTRTYPPGLDVEVWRTSVLREIVDSCDEPSFREYPIEFLKRHRRHIAELHLDRDLSWLHLTIDYPEDLAAANRIVEALDAAPDIDAWFAAAEELGAQFADKPRNIEYRAFLAEER